MPWHYQLIKTRVDSLESNNPAHMHERIAVHEVYFNNRDDDGNDLPLDRWTFVGYGENPSTPEDWDTYHDLNDEVWDVGTAQRELVAMYRRLTRDIERYPVLETDAAGMVTNWSPQQYLVPKEIARQRDRVRGLVESYYDEQHAGQGIPRAEWIVQWMNTPNPGLGYMTANDMIDHGQGQKLIEWMKQQLSENNPLDIEGNHRSYYD